MSSRCRSHSAAVGPSVLRDASPRVARGKGAAVSWVKLGLVAIDIKGRAWQARC
jgi:hypothetical protein